MTGKVAVFHIDLGQIDFLPGRIGMSGVAVEAVRHILGLLLVMRDKLVRIDHSAVGLEARLFCSQFVKRSSVAGKTDGGSLWLFVHGIGRFYDVGQIKSRDQG